MYEKILNYYFDSAYYFHLTLNDFKETFLLEGECGKERYRFYSDIGLLINKKTKQSCGFHLQLADSIIKKVFFTNYSDNQIFTAIFAHWYNFEEDKIKLVSNKNYDKYCCQILACFLNGVDNETIIEVFHSYKGKKERMNRLYSLSTPKDFYISIDNHLVHAVCRKVQKQTYLLTDTGQTYLIDYFYDS